MSNSTGTSRSGAFFGIRKLFSSKKHQKALGLSKTLTRNASHSQQLPGLVPRSFPRTWPLDSMIKVQATRNQWDSSTGFDGNFTWKYSPERSTHYFGRKFFVWQKFMFPALNHRFQGSFFFQGSMLLVSGLFGSNTNPGFSPTVTGWSQESTEAYPYWDSPRFSLRQNFWQEVFVCFYFYLFFFKKWPINGNWGRLKLPGPCICCTSTSTTCFGGGSNTEPSNSTEEHLERKTAAFTSVSGECITLTWWYPHLMDGSKNKSSGNICFKGKFAHLLLQFSFQLRRLLYQQTGNVERTHIFQEAANVCCQCFESPPPFHWATLTVKTKPLASAPARPKSACSWSSDRPYLVDPSKHCRVWLERFRGGEIEIFIK